MRKPKASNIPHAGGDTSNTLQTISKGVEAAPTPIITVTTPSKGSCNVPPPKKVLVHNRIRVGYRYRVYYCTRHFILIQL